MLKKCNTIFDILNIFYELFFDFLTHFSYEFSIKSYFFVYLKFKEDIDES